MSFIKVFKIRNGAGQWSNGGFSPTFSSKGKMWNSRGSLNSHIKQIATTHDHSARTYHFKKKPDDWMIFEITVDENGVGAYDANVITYPFNDIVETMKRQKALTEKYNSNFAELVTRIETKGQSADYQWALIAGGDYQTKVEVEGLTDAIKHLKLKRNTDYAACIAGDGAAVAFKNKNDALRVKLTATSKIQGVDILNYLEFDN